MLSALCICFRSLNEGRFLAEAKILATFIKDKLFYKSKLVHCYREEPFEGVGFAEDYASVIRGLLDFYAVSYDQGILQFAIQLQDILDDNFWDHKDFGYCKTEHSQSKLLPIKDRNNLCNK